MIVEIEADGPLNANPVFKPLSEQLRGRFDHTRCADKNERMELMDDWPEPIPGKRLAFDTATGAAAVIEPLHDPAHARLREKLEKRSWSLDPARKEISPETVRALADDCDPAATFLYWMKRMVDSGAARLTQGSFPTTEGKVRKQFFRAEDAEAVAHRRRSETTERQKLAAALAVMNDKQRAEYERILAEL